MGNNNKSFLVFVALVSIVGIGFFLIKYNHLNSARIGEEEGIACTMEARLCPDGSYVGRSGPKCEFTACPVVATTTSLNPENQTQSVSLQTRLRSGASGLGVKIVPTALLEDSRCPLNVTCIWAGTVKVQTVLTSALGDSNTVFTLNTAVTTEAEVITLKYVLPEKYADREIKSADYFFIFEVKKR